jgi:hypothetical protein
MDNNDKDYIDETSSDIIDETSTTDNNNDDSELTEMKSCRYCGTLTPTDRKYCVNCGRDELGMYKDNCLQKPAQELHQPPVSAYQPPQSARSLAPQKKRIGFALTALIISGINFLVFSSFLSFIAVPLALIFAIISLAKHHGGKPMAIIAIVLSVISAILFTLYVVIFIKIYPDFKYFVQHDRQIIEEFDQTGEIPEHFQKYNDSKYDAVWKRMGFDNFGKFFEFFVDNYRSTVLKEKKPSTAHGFTNEDRTTTTTPEGTSPGTTKFYDYDHSGEDLVVLS